MDCGRRCWPREPHQCQLDLPIRSYRSCSIFSVLLLTLSQDPKDEILASASDSFVKWNITFCASQPEIRLMLNQKPQSFRLSFGGTAIRRPKNKKKKTVEFVVELFSLLMIWQQLFFVLFWRVVFFTKKNKEKEYLTGDWLAFSSMSHCTSVSTLR